MTRYLLDTNIVSFLIKASYPALDHRFRRIPKNSLVISAICEAEVRFGLALLPSQAKVHSVAENFLRDIEIESWDSQCAKQYAELAASQQKQGKPLSPADTMIAAHALAHNFTLVTNDKAFARIRNLRVEDWTKGPQRA
jgi:tRNA(fMet)-specific endonuclease VapC